MKTDDVKHDGSSVGTPTESAAHIATYTRDKRTGQYLVRLQGPLAPDAEGHQVPVTRKNGKTEMEKLKKLVWSGFDDQDFPGHVATGEPVGLYEIEPKVREKRDFVF